MENLKDGIVYAIMRPCDCHTIYIGSTEKTEQQRLRAHQENYRKHLKGIYRYCGSFELVKFDDVEIYVIEHIKFFTKDELRRLEQKYITRYKKMSLNVLNVNKAYNKNGENITRKIKKSQENEETKKDKVRRQTRERTRRYRERLRLKQLEH